MMKYAAFTLCVLLLITNAVRAQSGEVSVEQHFSVEPPFDYTLLNTRPNWSPDGTLLALSFDKPDVSRRPVERLWQIYDVGTGELLSEYKFAGELQSPSSDTAFIWYADSSRLLIRKHPDVAPHIVDTRTGKTLFTLENAGQEFATVEIEGMITNRPIEDVIINRDDAETLRIYDAQTGDLRFMRENVTSLPVYSPDGTQFAITVAKTRVELYRAADFELLDTVDGFWVVSNSAVWRADGRQIIIKRDSAAPRWYHPFSIWTIGEGISAPIYNGTGGMSWSPDGAQIVVPSDYTKLRFYDSHTGELQETLRGFADDPIGWVSWEGRYLAGVIQDHQDSMHWDPRFQIWDFEREVVVYECDIPWYLSLNYHIENDVLEIWGFLISLRRVDLTTGEILYENVNKSSLDLSPDRQWYLIDYTNFEEGVPVPIEVYATETNELIATLSGHTNIVNTYWSPDSEHFASIGDPGIVIVWEVRHSN